MAQKKTRPAPKGPVGSIRITIRMSRPDHRELVAAATADGLKLGPWLRNAGKQRARQLRLKGF
jgi:hypothetical protein